MKRLRVREVPWLACWGQNSEEISEWGCKPCSPLCRCVWLGVFFPTKQVIHLCHTIPAHHPPCLLPPLSLQHGPWRQTREPLCRIMRDSACLCTEGFYPGGLCFFPSGAEIVFAEKLERHINSSSTCQQPPSFKLWCNILLPWDDSRIQGAKVLNLEDLPSHDSEDSLSRIIFILLPGSPSLTPLHTPTHYSHL